MRRKVVSANKDWMGTMWSCQLECGHFEAAYGRQPKGYVGVKEPPKTVLCTTCKSQKEAATALEAHLNAFTLQKPAPPR